MPKRCLRWIWRHRKLSLGLFLLGGLILLNLIAYMHAHAMTHFTPSGSRTPNPEDLSKWQKVRVVFCGVNIPRPVNETDPGRLELPFETRHLRTKDDVNLEGWYIPPPEPGAKGLVALFHGYSASKASLLREAHAFHDLGYATFLVDFRGSGGSDGNDTTIGVAEAADSPRLVAAMSEVQGQMSDLITLIAHPPEVLTHSNDQHRRLVRLLRRRDGPRAVRLMREHMEGTEHILVGLV